MSHEIAQNPPRRYGPRAVLVAIFLVILAGGLVALRFAYQQPSTTDARLLFHGKVLATMEPKIARPVQEGMPATVTIEGYEGQTFAGRVQVVDTSSEKETLVMVSLKNPPDDAKPPLTCTVQVDTHASLPR